MQIFRRQILLILMLLSAINSSKAATQVGSAPIDIQKTSWSRVPGPYIPRGATVDISWIPNQVQRLPDKYLVIYRLDPRLSIPELFIFRYNYKTKSYISDLSTYDNGRALKGKTATNAWSATDFTNYFQRIQKEGIPVKAGQNISITLLTNQQFFGDNNIPPINTWYVSTDSDTSASGFDNKIISASSSLWCKYLAQNNYSSDSTSCTNNGSQTYNISSTSTLLQGVNSDPQLQLSSLYYQDDDNTLGYFIAGTKMRILVGNGTIKELDDKFVSQGRFFDYLAKTAGSLIFQGPSVPPITDSAQIEYIQFGRYLMQIIIGDGETPVLENFQLKYTFSGFVPSDTYDGKDLPASLSLKNSDVTGGALFIKTVLQDQQADLGGTILANYKISNALTIDVATPLYNAVSQILDGYSNAVRGIYQALIQKLGNVARLLLTLYVVLMGVYFILGMIKFTLREVINRFIKILIVVILFSQENINDSTSWNFFNDHLFSLISRGITQLINNASAYGHESATYNSQNPFYFINGILDRYFAEDIIAAIVACISQQVSLIPVVICLILGIAYIFSAIAYVIVQYLITYISFYILVSITPIFIPFILFSQTKDFYSNWLHRLFGFLLPPFLNIVCLLFLVSINDVLITKLIEIVPPTTYAQRSFEIASAIREMQVVPGAPEAQKIMNAIAGTQFNIPQYKFGQDYQLDLMTILSSSLIFYVIGKMLSETINASEALAESLTGVSSQKSIVDRIGNDVTSTIKSVANTADQLMGSPVKRNVNKVKAYTKKIPTKLTKRAKLAIKDTAVGKALYGTKDGIKKDWNDITKQYKDIRHRLTDPVTNEIKSITDPVTNEIKSITDPITNEIKSIRGKVRGKVSDTVKDIGDFLGISEKSDKK